MKKKWIFILTLALVMAFATGAAAKTAFDIIKAEIRTDFTIEIDGEIMEFKNAQGERVHPVLHDGTTYLPLRAIGEIMGKTVYWHESEKRIELKDEKKNDAPTVTDADVIVDGAEKSENVKPEIATDESGFIGKEKAKEIALEKAGLTEADVTFVKVELDKEKSVYVYEVEFKKGNKEYSADIKATDGTVVDWDVDFDD